MLTNTLQCVEGEGDEVLSHSEIHGRERVDVTFDKITFSSFTNVKEVHL